MIFCPKEADSSQVKMMTSAANSSNTEIEPSADPKATWPKNTRESKMLASQSKQMAATRRPIPATSPGVVTGTDVPEVTHPRYRGQK